MSAPALIAPSDTLLPRILVSSPELSRPVVVTAPAATADRLSKAPMPPPPIFPAVEVRSMSESLAVEAAHRKALNPGAPDGPSDREIGRASCRERVCPYV